MRIITIYLISDLSHEELAAKFRQMLNIPLQNQCPYIKEQERDNLSLGGIYYCLESLGLFLNIIKNAGEASLDESKNMWDYYVEVQDREDTLGKVGLLAIGKHILQICQKNGLKSEMDTDTTPS